MANIKKRGAGYRVQVYVRGQRDSRTFDTHAEAKEWGAKRETELRTPQPEKQEVEGNEAEKTLGELLEDVKTSTTRLSRTRRSRTIEDGRIDRMKKHPICSKVVRLLKPKDFVDYKESREAAGVSQSTIRRELSIVRAAIYVLVESGKLAFNPVQSTINALPDDIETARLLSDAEIERFRQAYEDNRCKSRNPWLYWAFQLAAETGLRKAELLGLRWGDVLFEQLVMQVQRVDDLPDGAGRRYTEGTKNGDHKRDVPLSPAALEILQCLPRAIDPTRREQVIPVSYNALSCAFKRLKRAAGIKDFRWHDLRHMAATKFIETLRSIPEVAVITGHKNWSSLERYTHIKAENVAKRLHELEAENATGQRASVL